MQIDRNDIYDFVGYRSKFLVPPSQRTLRCERDIPMSQKHSPQPRFRMHYHLFFVGSAQAADSTPRRTTDCYDQQRYRDRSGSNISRLIDMILAVLYLA